MITSLKNKNTCKSVCFCNIQDLSIYLFSIEVHLLSKICELSVQRNKNEGKSALLLKARVCEDYKGHFIETDVNVNKRSANVVLKQMVGKKNPVVSRLKNVFRIYHFNKLFAFFYAAIFEMNV